MIKGYEVESRIKTDIEIRRFVTSYNNTVIPIARILYGPSCLPEMSAGYIPFGLDPSRCERNQENHAGPIGHGAIPLHLANRLLVAFSLCKFSQIVTHEVRVMEKPIAQVGFS